MKRRGIEYIKLYENAEMLVSEVIETSGRVYRLFPHNILLYVDISKTIQRYDSET